MSVDIRWRSGGACVGTDGKRRVKIIGSQTSRSTVSVTAAVVDVEENNFRCREGKGS